MKKFKFLTLLIALTMIFSFVGCSKAEKGEQGIQGPQGEQGVQGLPGADGVGITSVTVDGNYVVITYTNGNVERIALDVFERETLTINVKYYENISSLSSIRQVKVVKGEKLLPQLEDYFYEVIDDVFDSDSVVESVYYGTELIDKDYVVEDVKELSVFMIDFDAVEPEYNENIDTFMQFLQQNDENIYIEAVINDLTSFAAKFITTHRMLYKSDLLEIANLQNEYFESRMNDFKEILKYAMLVNIMTLSEYDVATLEAIDAIFDDIFVIIDGYETFEDAVDFFDLTEEIFSDLEFVESEDTELVDKKYNLLNMLYMICNAISFTSAITPSQMDVEVLTAFIDKSIEIVYCNDIEELNKIEETLMIDWDYQIEDHFVIIIRKAAEDDEVQEFFAFLESSEPELYNKLMEYYNSDNNNEFAQAYYSISKYQMIYGSNKQQLNTIVETYDDVVHNALVNESYVYYFDSRDAFVSEFLNNLPLEPISEEQLDSFTVAFREWLEQIKPELEYDELLYYYFYLDGKNDVLYNYSSKYGNDMAQRIESASTVEEYQLIEKDMMEFERLITIYEQGSDYNFDNFIKNYRDTNIKNKVLDKISLNSYYAHMANNLDYFISNYVDDNYSKALTTTYVVEYMNEIVIDLEFYKTVIAEFITNQFYEQGNYSIGVEKIKSFTTEEELDEYCATFEFAYFSYGLYREFVSLYTRCSDLLKVLDMDQTKLNESTEEQKAKYYKANDYYSEGYDYQMGYKTFSLDGTDPNEIALSPSNHQNMLDHLNECIRLLEELISELNLGLA